MSPKEWYDTPQTRRGTNPLVKEGKRCHDCIFYKPTDELKGECNLKDALVINGIRHISIVVGSEHWCDQLKLK